LLELGFHLVFCTRTPESFEAARAERLKVSGNPKQYDSLQVFIHEQELIRRLVSQTNLPTLELDISDNDVAGAANRIADWMADTGGLWARG
jgi:regulator of PEP synthase PpsR (kinase-PPPase family)